MLFKEYDYGIDVANCKPQNQLCVFMVFRVGLNHIWPRRVMFILCDKIKKLFSHQTFIL